MEWRSLGAEDKEERSYYLIGTELSWGDDEKVMSIDVVLMIQYCE